ncbi:MAG: hypothetical protein HY231_24230 [Acidobacteria bacterium]|nr:hypothetical protein [Acidobacteriota bacterium]
MDDTRPFPIQGGEFYRDEKGDRCFTKGSTIPWWLAAKAYEAYRAKYGSSQSLEQIAERGGFGREELLMLFSEVKR